LLSHVFAQSVSMTSRANCNSLGAGGVTHNAVKHFNMPKNAVYCEASVIFASDASS
jgi:hypothetical protein